MDKKTIVITGSTRAIGYGLASQLLTRGHEVLINGTNEAGVGKRVEEFKEQGYEVLGIAEDVSHENCFQSIINAAVERYGKIFNMEGFGSDGRIMEKLTLYGTSKRAVNYFTKSVSREVKGENIQIGILSPGMVRTDFLAGAMSSGTPEEQAKNKKVFDILAEDVDVVTAFLADKIVVSKKQYDRIEFLTKRRLIPKIVKLIFVK